jgi:ATP-dependent helicase/nuclease subunit A
MSDLHLNPIGNSLWRAGAGAGKTYNLVRRVMRIADEWSRSHEGAFPRLVVTTFTRMATQELRVRLMEAALVAAAEGKKELIPFVTSRSHLFVTTLHGVMDSFLRSFGSEIGLEPGFRVGGADEIDSLVRRVGNRILFPKTMASGDDEKAKLVAAVDELLNEFDFGMTLRLLQRTARVRLEFQGEVPEARPATRADMLASMALSLKDLARPIHDLQEEIVLHSPDPKWEPFSEWLKALAKGLSAVSSEDLHLEGLEEWVGSQPKITNSGKHKIDFGAGADWKDPIGDVKDAIESLKSEVEAIEKFEKINTALAFVETHFSKALREEKFRSGLIELEDLELLALELIRKSPEAAARYAEGWDHWLIDEYQDTSPRQVLLIAALAKDRPQFVVGDPQQSIYLFRGARPNVFLDREEHAIRDGHEKTDLLGNRRSHADVMSFVNHAVANLGDDFQIMTAARPAGETEGRRQGSIASPFGAATLLAMEAATVEDASGKLKSLKVDELRRLEAIQVSRAVGQLLTSGASPASIAVLARSNKDLSIIAREFATQSLPFQVHTAGAYSDRLEVSDLCALLSFLSNPHDDENLIHLARTVWFPIDEEILARGFRRKTSLWSVLETQQALEGSRPEIEVLQSGLLAARERGLVQAFREMLMSCDFFSWCGRLDPSGRREANALKFLAKVAVAERQAGFVPRRFVDEVLGGGDRGSDNESNDRDAVAAVKPDRIHIMTIHVSKGLEFDHVFLPFLSDAPGRGRSTSEFILHEQKRVWSAGLSIDDDGTLSAGPLAREWNAILQEWGVEEQKRLLYVALTRARESLFLSSTGEPKTGSFLQTLRLSREAGQHGPYRTVLDVPIGQEIRSATAAVETSRDPWGRIDRKHSDNVFAGISVTRLLEIEDENEALLKSGESPTPSPSRANLLSKRSLSMAVAAARGTRLHRVFEMAKPDAARSADENRELLASEIVRWFVEDEQAGAREALQWLLALQEPDLSVVLTTGQVEWSFTYVRGAYAVDGQIDLWGRDSEGRLWVIDYKTGDSSYREKALRQLKYYAEALLAGGLAKVGETAYLCALYPFSKEVFTESVVLQS